MKYDEHNISTVHDKMSVKKLRNALGIPEAKEGKISCLKCSKDFLSQDKKKHRICDVCKGSKEADFSEYFVGICY